MSVVNINEASADDLRSLQGIGASRASRILSARVKSLLSLQDMSELTDIRQDIWQGWLQAGRITFGQDVVIDSTPDAVNIPTPDGNETHEVDMNMHDTSIDDTPSEVLDGTFENEVQVASVERRLKFAREECKQLENELTTTRTDLHKYRGKCSAQKSELDELHEENVTLQARNKGLRADKRWLQEQLDAEQSKGVHLTSSVERQKRLAHDYSQQLSELQDENHRLIEELRQVKQNHQQNLLKNEGFSSGSPASGKLVMGANQKCDETIQDIMKVHPKNSRYKPAQSDRVCEESDYFGSNNTVQGGQNKGKGGTRRNTFGDACQSKGNKGTEKSRDGRRDGPVERFRDVSPVDLEDDNLSRKNHSTRSQFSRSRDQSIEYEEDNCSSQEEVDSKSSDDSSPERHDRRKNSSSERHARGHDRMVRGQRKRSSSPQPPKLPTFSGAKDEDWDSFYAQFSRAARNADWSERKKLKRLYPCLRGQAAVYANRADCRCFKDLKKSLQRRFGQREDPALARRKVRHATQLENESLEEFGQRVLFLVQDAFCHDKSRSADVEATEYFLQGAKDKQAALYAMSKRPNCLRKAIKYVKEHQANNVAIFGTRRETFKQRQVTWNLGDETESDVRVLESINHNQKTQPKPNNQDLDDLKRQVQELSNLVRQQVSDSGQRQSRQQSPIQPQSQTSLSRSQSPQCFKCRGYGHLARTCPSRDRSSSVDSRRSPSPSGTQSKASNSNGLGHATDA